MTDNDDLARLRIDRSGPDKIPRRRRHVGRWVLAATLVLAVFGGVWRWVLNPVVEVSILTVSRLHPSQAFTVLNASGYVVAQRKASVASKGSGRLLWLGVEEGMAVKKGQVIARLESDDLRATADQVKASRETAQSNRTTARANRDNAASARDAVRSNLDQARVELDDATISFEREKKLLAEGITTRASFDVADARRRRAQAVVAAAQRTLEAAEHTVAAAESSLAAAQHTAVSAAAGERVAAVNVAYTEIRAPFDGVVLTKNADVGDMVTPLGSAANAQAAVVTMADLSSLQVEADVSESNLGKVRAGQPCEVRLDALPDERFPAVVHMIVPTADRAKGTVMAKVRFLRLDPRILPEMSAKVAFLERPVRPDEDKPRTAVSPEAVVTRGGAKIVFRVQAGRAVETRVTLGAPMGELVEVKSGLTSGEKVVSKPPARLRGGARVKVPEG